MGGVHSISQRQRRIEWICEIYKYPPFHVSTEKSAGLCHVGLSSYIVVMVLALGRRMHLVGMQVIERLHADTAEDRARWGYLGSETRCWLQGQLWLEAKDCNTNASLAPL